MQSSVRGGDADVVSDKTARTGSITAHGGRRSNSAANLRCSPRISLLPVEGLGVAMIGIAQPRHGLVELAQPTGRRVVEVRNVRHQPSRSRRSC